MYSICTVSHLTVYFVETHTAGTLVEYAKPSKTIYYHNTYVCKSVNSCSIKECVLPRIWNHMSHSNGLSNVLNNVNYRFAACAEVPQFLVSWSTD